MQLLYLYIGGREKSNNTPFGDLTDNPYKVLKNVELNFSNDLIFSYNTKSGALILEEESGYINDFFDEEGKIKNVTALIGKNGTGKSSILELIKSLRPDNYDNHFYKLLIVFESVNVSGRSFHIYHHPELTVKPSTELQLFRDIFGTKQCKSFKDFEPYEKIFPDYQVINYSTLFEVQQSRIVFPFEYYGDKNIEDISTIHLLQKDAEYHTNTSFQTFSSREVMMRHKLMETQRQVQFLINLPNSEEFLDFTPPRFLEITVDHIDELILSKKESKPYSFLTTLFDNTKKSIRTRKEVFLFDLHRAALFNTIRYFNVNPIEFDDINLILNKRLNNNISPDRIQDLIIYIATEFERTLAQKNIVPENPISERLKALAEALRNFEQLDDADFVQLDQNTAAVLINIDVPLQLNILINYLRSVNLSGFINLDWRFEKYSTGQMSSGEKAIFSMFARFYFVYEKAVTFKETNKSILIIIDEGDQLFHPEWQRKYFALLMKYFPKLFSYANEIQVVLTTHSPFIASDLPPYSVIKLNKDGKFTTASRISDQKSTFAANIHELFKDDFYLESGLVGEFAKGKILSLTKRIKRLVPEDNTKQILLEIDLISEPLIREKLLTIMLGQVAQSSGSSAEIVGRLNNLRIETIE